MSEIEEKVKAIIVEKLGVDAAQVTMEASFSADLNADSLDTVELIMELVLVVVMDVNIRVMELVRMVARDVDLRALELVRMVARDVAIVVHLPVTKLCYIE